MFSEYFDIKKGDILRGLDEKITDEFSDEKQSDKNSEVLQPSKEDNKITKILETHINSRTGEYWSFFNNFPNAFHVDTSGRSIGKDIYEVGESEIGGITEKKIKGFDKTFEDGKSVEVREDNGDILFSFLDEGKNNKTTIILSNFQNFGKKLKNGETLAAPNISITGDTSVLPDSIQKHTNNINGNIDFSKDNAKIFKEIFDSIDQNIMRPKIEEFHGYVDNVKKNTEDLFFKISTENIDEIDVLNSLRGNNFIDSLIKDYNYDNFTIEDYSDLMSRKIALSLCLLLRNSSKTEIKNSIKKILGYDEDSGVEQKDKLNKDENSIEFIPVDEFFIANGDVLISLAVEFVKNNPSMKNAEEIIKILTS